MRPREIKEKSRRFREANWGCLMTTTRITDFFCPLCLHNLMQAETYQGQKSPRKARRPADRRIQEIQTEKLGFRVSPQ